MPRFTSGTRVVIMGSISTRYRGFTGQISNVIPHRTGRETLDKYEVTFANGERAVFWDIQLSRVDGDEPAQHTKAGDPLPPG